MNFSVAIEALGLPRDTAAVLTTLLAEHSVSSWKITGDGDTTVFVLRLCSTGTTGSTPLQHAAWRRKAQSQLRRDRQRAELHRQQRQGQNSQPASSETILTTTDTTNINRDNNINQTTDSTPVKTVFDADKASGVLLSVFCETKTNEPDITHCASNTATHDTRKETPGARDSCSMELDVGQEHGSASDSVSSVFVNKPATRCEGDSANRDDLSFETEVVDIEQLATEAGIKVEYVEKCAREVRDRKIRRSLRDETRNKTFHKVVLDHRWGREVLVGESDDFLVTFDPVHDGFFHWSIKHNPGQYERQMLSYVESWSPADTEHYKAEMDIMLRKLDILCSLFESLLN